MKGGTEEEEEEGGREEGRENEYIFLTSIILPLTIFHPSFSFISTMYCCTILTLRLPKSSFLSRVYNSLIFATFS